MSAAELSDTVKTRIFNLYKSGKLSLAGFQQASRESIFKKFQDTAKFRGKYESGKSGHTGIFTQAGTSKLISEIIDEVKDVELKALVRKTLDNIDLRYFAEVWVQEHLPDKGTFTKISSDDTGIDFKLSDVPQDTVKSLFLDYIDSTLSISGSIHQDRIVSEIAKNIQSGHLAGVFSLKLKAAAGVQVVPTVGGTYRDFTVTMDDAEAGINEYTQVIDKALKLLLDADYVTSNLHDNIEIFTSATKSVLGDEDVFLSTEMQLSRLNKEAGDLLQQTGRKLNAFIDAYAPKTKGQFSSSTMDATFKELIKSLESVATYVLNKSEEIQQLPNADLIAAEIISNAGGIKELGNILINTEGSPSIIEAITDNIISTVLGKKKKTRVITSVSSKRTISTKDPAANAEIKEVHANLGKLALSIKKTKQVTLSIKNESIKRAATILPTAGLLALLNAKLYEQIQKNMGTGNETKVLNFRSGRLAESARVERISQSRAGMVSAFYSYMRNPYGTFSEGGKQQYPRSRDPKALISKSIREIGATMVGNRMRAVLV